MTDKDVARQIAENPDPAPNLTVKRAKRQFLVASPRLKTGLKIRLVRRAVGTGGWAIQARPPSAN